MNRQAISKLVKASGVSAGEMILIHFWGEDADKEIANDFVVSVAEMGATPVLLQQSRQMNRDIFRAAKESCFGTNHMFGGTNEASDHIDFVGRGTIVI